MMMGQTATASKTIRGLWIGLGALVVAIVAQAVIVWAILDHQRRIDVADGDVRAELLHYSTMEGAISDQVMGLRGYRLDHDPQSLAIYEAGRRCFDAGIAELRQEALDDTPAVRARVEEIIAVTAAWNRDLAEPQIAALKAGRDVPPTASLGQGYGVKLRTDFAYLHRYGTALLETRDRTWEQSFTDSRITLLLGSGAALVFAIQIAWRALRRLSIHRAVEQDAAAKVAAALDRAQAAERAKSVFLANMSHEMLTPLNGVAGMAGALAQTDLTPSQRQLVGVVRNSARDLEGLIGNLLTLSHGERKTPRRTTAWAFHLADEVRVIIADSAQAARAKGLRFDLDIDPCAVTRVRADAAKLEKVLTCLLSNAVKFTEAGGVRLSVSRLAGDCFRFQVSDTGIGFDMARKLTLFQRFSQSDDSATRRFGGAGIGLAVAHQVATELGGRLDVRASPGDGSIFTFEVDLPAPEPEPRPDTPNLRSTLLPAVRGYGLSWPARKAFTPAP